MKLEKYILDLKITSKHFQRQNNIYLYLHLGQVKVSEHGRTPCLTRIKKDNDIISRTPIVNILLLKLLKEKVLQCIGP
jgi:hypothetical protein